ncbi:PA2169 family four-helix-bundle protein [Aquimarina sp. ERC-38]|uniref:ferritin-like domain-containing protein n=1 Tax=Aquimarina sp. ERC-38 TaxID=2949996 RepID=UPI00224714E4|nr:PA2169 family four-helix-bundle protein [Aquimarina sp. ERC-38]UZO80365.1 PA2169 family four-helix-bundle protein [Aquimarina sp. ERC-38]
MNATTDKIYDELQEILEKNRDAVKGYKKAAENTDHSGLKAYFERKATERSQFNSELGREIKAAYTDFDIDGSFAGSIHRAWMDVKSLFSADDAESMLEESIRGDKAAIDEYNDVLEETGISQSLRSLLTQQRNKIQQDISKNNSLENLH